MLFLLSQLACSEFSKTYYYDISSTIFVTDDAGVKIDAENVEFCQHFSSVDYDTRTDWELLAKQCEVVDIEDGFVTLSNWEGDYFGPDVSIFLDMTVGEEVYAAELMGDDNEVWCDNQVVTEVDEYNHAISYDSLCAENYERYLVWSLEVPQDLFP